MSNARSPRDVCSTTIGTSGLIVLASFAYSAGFLPNVATGQPGASGVITSERARFFAGLDRRSGASAAGCPELASARSLLLALLPRRPQLLPGLGLLDADRLGLLDEQVDRQAGRDVVAHALQATALAQLLE